MTNERAIEQLKDQIAPNAENASVEAIGLAISALEYRTPKKPIIGDTFFEKFQKAIVKTGSHPDIAKGQSYKCPVCHQGIITLWEAERNKKAFGYLCKDNFCKKCGQALDWT